jgi:2-succinyl-6-hydroxy-2,4-cyclohexadiene-1-carboxylate synthase
VPELKVPGARVVYDVGGDGPAVTLLHGFTQSRVMWDEVAEGLGAGWRLLSPDLRGHGQTEVEPGGAYTMDACLGDLDALWGALGVDRTHLVGYSMGGRLALHVATRRPDRLLSLVTVSARTLPEPARAARREADEELARAIEHNGIEWFVEHWSSLPMFAGVARRGGAFNRALRERRLRNRPRELAASLRERGAGAAPPVDEGLRGLRAPALFVAGSEDRPYVEAAATLAAMVPRGRVEIVDGAGHNVPAERPRELAALLKAHLSAR